MAGRDDFLQWLRGLLKGSDDGIISSSAGTKAVDEATALTDNVFTMKPKSDYDETIESLNKTKAEFDDHIQSVSGPIEAYMKKTTEFLEGETWTEKYFRNRAEDFEIADHMYKYGLYDRPAYLRRLDEIQNEYNAARYKQVVENDIKAGNKVKEDPYKDVASSEGGLHPILDESEILPEPSFMQNEGAKIESFSDVQKRRGVGPFADDVKDNVVNIDDGKTWNPNEFDENFTKMKKDDETGLGLIKKGIDEGKIKEHDEADFFNVGEPVKIGVQNEDAMWKVLERELYDIDKVRTPYGTPESMLSDLYLDIQNGTRYGIANDQQRLKMLERIKESMKNFDMSDYFPENFIDETPFVINNGKKITASGTIKVSSEIEEEMAKIQLEAFKHKKMLDEAGIDTSNVDWDILTRSKDLEEVKTEALKLSESLPFSKSLEADSALAQADVATVKGMMDEAQLSGSATKYDEGKELLLKIREAYEESIDSGVYISPLKKRTEHATGGRIGFSDGDRVKGKLPMTRRGFLGTVGGGILAAMGIRGGKEVLEQIVTKGSVQEVIAAPGMPDWFPLLVKKIRQKGNITKQSEYKEVTDEGINIIEYKLKDDSLTLGEINMTEDLTTGEVTIWGRGDDYQAVDLTFTPGDRIQNVQSGKVSEQASSFNAEAQTMMAGQAERRGGVLGNQDTTTDLMGKHSVDIKEGNRFEASEFAKGHEGWADVENFGTIDDLQGGIASWENLVKTDVERLDEAAKIKTNFLNTQKKPIEPDFAQGGRVGLQGGGILGQLNTNQQNDIQKAFNLGGQMGAQGAAGQINSSQPTLSSAVGQISNQIGQLGQGIQQMLRPPPGPSQTTNVGATGIRNSLDQWSGRNHPPNRELQARHSVLLSERPTFEFDMSQYGENPGTPGVEHFMNPTEESTQQYNAFQDWVSNSQNVSDQFNQAHNAYQTDLAAWEADKNVPLQQQTYNPFGGTASRGQFLDHPLVTDLRGRNIHANNASTITPENRLRPEDYILQRGVNTAGTNSVSNYANGGLTRTVPPQRGPLANGIGTRFKEKRIWQ